MRTGAHELTCRELVELVTEYLEGAMARATRAAFEEHLAACEDCSIYLQQMRRTIELTGTLTEESISPAAAADLMRAFKDWRTRRAAEGRGAG
jgi:predicted anti-sigma-YlaC factor YlaD